jgi:hypothetical protein
MEIERNVNGNWEPLNLYTKDGDTFRKAEIEIPTFDSFKEKFFDGDVAYRRDWPEDSPDRDDEVEATYFDYTELKWLSQSSAAIGDEFNYDTEEYEKINILEEIFKKVDLVTNLYDMWFIKPNQVRVIFFYA